MLRLSVLFLLSYLVCSAVCQDENVLLFGVCSDGTVRTLTPSSGYVVSDPSSPPKPQSLIPTNFVTQLAVDPVGKLGFAPQTLRGPTGGSFDPRNFSLAVYSLDTDRQTGNNALQTTLALPWANTYQSAATFNLFWEASEGVVLVGNALDATSPYQLWSVSPSTGALTQLFEWPSLYGFQAGAGAYNQTSQQLYLLQTKPGLAVTTLDLTTLSNTSVPVGTTVSVHSVTVLGLGLAFDTLHAVFTWADEDSTGSLVTTVHYGLLDPRTGLLTSLAQLDNSLIPSLTSCTVAVAEGTDQLYLTAVNPSSASGPSSVLLVLQLFTGRVLRVLDLWNAPVSTTFYASAAVSTSPSPLVSFNALASSAEGQSLTIAPLDDGWLLASSTSLAKLDANGSPVWRLPFSGFLSDSANGLAIGNKGRTAFFGSTAVTFFSPAQLSVVDVSTSSTPSLITVPNAFPVPSDSQASFFSAMVSTAASQSVAVFGNNLGVFAKNCGNPCTGYVASTLSFCDVQLTCNTVVLNATSLFSQALSGNGAYFFYGTNNFISVYAAFPQTSLLTSWNPLSLGLQGIASTAAASYSGSLAIFGFTSSQLVFLTSSSSGKFQPTVFAGPLATWVPKSVACTETVVVAAFYSSGAAYNISFYRSAAQGTVPQLVASYTPFPGASLKGYYSSPVTTALTSDGRYAIVGGIESLGSNLWIFDLNTIDPQQLTIQPPVNGYLPGSVQQLRLLDSSGRLGVATTASQNPNTSRNFAFAFDI